MDAQQVELAMKQHALLIDTRGQEQYRQAHIKGSWFIGLNGQFAPWAGALITDMHQPIVIIADEGKEQEAIMRLARVGYDNVLGYLSGGVEAWKSAGKATVNIPSISPEDFAAQGVGSAKVLDVRKPSEFEESHLINADNVPLDFFSELIQNLDMRNTYAVHCKGGYRSMIAASILEANGANGVIDMMGGFDKIRLTNAPVTAAAQV